MWAARSLRGAEAPQSGDAGDGRGAVAERGDQPPAVLLQAVPDQLEARLRVLLDVVGGPALTRGGGGRVAPGVHGVGEEAAGRGVGGDPDEVREQVTDRPVGTGRHLLLQTWSPAASSTWPTSGSPCS